MIVDRPAIDLAGEWAFVRDPERRLEPGRLPAGEPIVVPGAWEAQLAQPYGVVHGWYSRRFSVPTDWADGILLLRFGSAMSRSRVWLDGHLLGEHDDGYLPFEVEAGAAVPGADHELTVSVENPINIVADYPAFGREALRAAADRLDGRSFDSLPHGKQTWYTSTSGLLGGLVAELAPDPRLASVVALPDLDASTVLVRWRLAGARSHEPATLSLNLMAPNGEIVARTMAESGAGEAVLPVEDPDTWDLWRPRFYRLSVRLEGAERSGDDGSRRRAVDEASVRFGMRSIGIRNGDVLLNGRPIYLRGALDQDLWPERLTSAPSHAALVGQAERARDMGLNLLRCHVKVPDAAYLDVADEMGLLVWCELPSWTRFEMSTGRTARRMLARMVETMGSHPSIVAWTVINEDWGMDLRHSARDRRWLRTTVGELRALDPSRLVIDNSACETPHGPNFHLRTDLADFHAYRSMPDGLPRWRSLVADFAKRPAWLWSPHGDAEPDGHEPLVLSEFGAWGLPRPSAVWPHEAAEPWWWSTGQTFRRPAGIHRRFSRQRLDRVWRDVDALAEATQWRQFDALVGQIRELRRYGSIRGYVVTELADAFWEANGLLDVHRTPKAFSDRVGEVNGCDALIVDLPRFDLWSGERLECDVIASSFPDGPDHPAAPGVLEWQVVIDEAQASAGSSPLREWPRSDAKLVARLEVRIPDVDRVSCAELRVAATSSGSEPSAVYRQALVLVPRATVRVSPRRIAVVDPLRLWSIEARIDALGHELVSIDRAEVVVASQLDRELLDAIDGGLPALLLVRSVDAVPNGSGLARPISVRRRRPSDGSLQYERPWDGDWSGVFAWATPGTIPGLSEGGLLTDAHAEIFPDLVLDGLDVASPSDGVDVGLFSGWVHSPVALLASFKQGKGRLIMTTLRLAPEDGPIATAQFESLLQLANGSRPEVVDDPGLGLEPDARPSS